MATATGTRTGTIAGFFDDHADAEKAVRALQDAGFSSAHMGVAHRGQDVTSTGYDSNEDVVTEDQTTRRNAEGKGEGVWDKVKDFFGAGNEAEAYSSEAAGDRQGTDVIAPDARGGYGYGAGDLHGTLAGMDVPEERSKYFDHRFAGSENGAVVTVNAGDRADEAESILEQYGADLGDSSEGYDYSAAPASTTAREGVQNIQLLGEALRVHKERISRGEVRMHKEVVTEMQTIEVPVTREELVIERHAVNDGRQVQGTIGDTGEIRIPLSEERAGVDKSTFVREEVSVGKRAVESTQNLQDQVRHEELVVEDDTKSLRDDRNR